jgi:hypothetical protein
VHRDCLVDKVVGAVCVGCKTRKYGCDHTGKTEAKTMWVSRPDTDSDSEVEVVEEPKGRKRRAESPVVPKKESVVKVEKPKTTTTKAKTATTKATTKGKAKQRAPPRVVLDSPNEEADLMVVDEESEEEPKPKRARVAKGNDLLRYICDCH